MEPAIIGLLGTLLGGSLVGFFNLYQKRQEFKFQTAQDDRRWRRTGLEDLHKELSIYIQIIGHLGVDVTLLRDVDLPILEKIRGFGDLQKRIVAPIGSLHSLHRRFAPSLADEWSRYLRATEGFSKTCAEYLNGEKDGNHLIENAMTPIYESCYKMMDQVEDLLPRDFGVDSVNVKEK